MPQQPPASRFQAVIYILIVIWILWSPDTGTPFPAGHDLAKQRIARHKAALGVLNTSSWGDFAPRQQSRPLDAGPPPDSTLRYLNLTGFRQDDGYAWEDLDRFRDRCLEWSRTAIPPVGGEDLWDKAEGEPVWQNASGLVRGSWVRRSGSVFRGWDGYNLSRIAPSFEWIHGRGSWARNNTGEEGKMMVKIDNKKTELDYEQLNGRGVPKSGGKIRGVKALLTVEDSIGSGLSWHMRLHGVHWPKQGTLLLTTTSQKFDGIFALPHLSPSADFFQSSQRLLNETVYKVLSEQEGRLFVDSAVPWTSDLDTTVDTTTPSPHCEYVMYAQVHPPDRSRLDMTSFNPETESMADIIGVIEEELRWPQGTPIRGVPELQMSAVIWSPDCGFFLETKGPPHFTSADGQHLTGMKSEVMLYEAKVWILALALVMFGQVYFLRIQVKEAFTPSTLGRVSYLTISMMLMADGLVFGCVCAWVLSASATLLPSLAVAFASFLSLSIGGSWLSDIHNVQEPLWRRRARDQANSTTNNSNSTPPPPSTPVAETSDSLPRPVTAGPPRGTTAPDLAPIIIPSDQDVDAEIAEQEGAAAALPPPRGATATPREQRETPFSSVVARFIFAGIVLLFVFMAATAWYPRVRAAFFNAVFLAYLSMWAPQVHRNAMRNCRRALSWRFVAGQSALRLCPLAYFYLREDNFLLSEPDRAAFAVFCAWVWVQLWALACQDVLGPRFGLPRAWTPDAWDYHRVLREDNLEAGGLPIGLVSAPGSPALERRKSGEDRGRRKGQMRVIDCAICREDLEVPVVRAGDEDPSAGGVVGVFARRMYMVTPCRHMFHSACLEGWMRFRLQCPICREELPPL